MDIMKILDTRILETKNFIKLLKEIPDTSNYNRVQLFKNMPFRNSNFDYELEQLMNYTKMSFGELRILLQVLNGDLYADYTDLINFIYNNGLTFDSYKLNTGDWRLGTKVRPDYINNPVLYEAFKELYDDLDNTARPAVVGALAEDMLYRSYSTVPTKDVEYVARDVGDGFGFDLMVKDKITKFVDLYEIKAVTGNRIERELTNNESDIFRSCDYPNSNERYHVQFFVYERVSYEPYEIEYDVLDYQVIDGKIYLNSSKGHTYSIGIPTQEEPYKKLSFVKLF